jgi:predicted small integral membrane protein
VRRRRAATEGPRVGFLPIETNMFDRVFIGVVIWVALNLLWMRFLEDDIALPFATLLYLPVFFFIVLRG